MPKAKKVQKSSASSDSDSGPDDRAPPSKKTKDSKSDTKEEANTWILEKYRQVRINEFRGRKMVDIREFYEKNGEILPGKKGICLSILQWKKLLEVAEKVTAAVES